MIHQVNYLLFMYHFINNIGTNDLDHIVNNATMNIQYTLSLNRHLISILTRIYGIYILTFMNNLVSTGNVSLIILCGVHRTLNHIKGHTDNC